MEAISKPTVTHIHKLHAVRKGRIHDGFAVYVRLRTHRFILYYWFIEENKVIEITQDVIEQLAVTSVEKIPGLTLMYDNIPMALEIHCTISIDEHTGKPATHFHSWQNLIDPEKLSVFNVPESIGSFKETRNGRY